MWLIEFPIDQSLESVDRAMLTVRYGHFFGATTAPRRSVKGEPYRWSEQQVRQTVASFVPRMDPDDDFVSGCR
jgi:hypothetical protein